ncbi:divisome protein SepX/GlpR [Mycobacterium sp. NPDC003323]
MPSIPQSLLWISLVVLWLFVLVPMLVSKRDNVRRTSDVALATRVLNSGRNARLRRPRAAAGHHSDPDWKPSADADAEFDADLEAELDGEPSRKRAVVLAAAAEEPTESPYLDVDIVDEDSGALPVGSLKVETPEEPETDELTLDFDGTEPEPEPEPDETVAESATEDDDLGDDDYEYVEDTSGLEAEDGLATDDEPELAESMASARRNRYESKTAQAVSARKYTFRKRMLLGMSLTLLVSVVLALVLSSTLWWVAGAAGAFTALYLAYLRRQTRIEEQLRRRRAQRMMRSRLGVENTEDGEFDVVPSRLRRPGAAVLEIDDEDPIFEHLEYASFSRHYDLPRAAGQ